MKVKEVITLLKRDGWISEKRKGTSHIQFSHPSKKGKVTISDHKGDIPPKTLKSILKQAGLQS